MKKLLPLCLLCLMFTCLTLDAKADYQMPSSAFRMSHIEEAKAEAALKGKAISLIYTHEHTDCGLNMDASLNAAQWLNHKTVVVYVNCNSETNALPENVQKALESPEVFYNGRQVVPQIVIVDPKLSQIFAVIPYSNNLFQHTQLMKNAMKKIPSYFSKNNE